MDKKEKFIIIDGNSLASRAFYALPLLRTSRGQYTNAVYGFTNMLLRLLEEEKPEYMVVTFDKAAPTFRHQVYQEYKARREKSPVEYREQIPVIKQLLEAYAITTMEKEGYEADDLIGFCCRVAQKKQLEALVVTGDMDIYQLISPGVTVLMTRKGISATEKVDERVLWEKHGLHPWQVPDYKALKGDPSDNIPGIPGIGEKTALKLLKNYGSLEKMLENPEEIREPKFRQKIIDYGEQARMSRELATIFSDIGESLDLENCRVRQEGVDYGKIKELFRSLEFNSLLEKQPFAGEVEGGVPVEKAVSRAYSLVRDRPSLDTLLGTLKKAGEVALILEATDPNPFQAGLVGITLGLSPENIFYIPLSTGESGGNLLEEEEVLGLLKGFLEDQEVLKICADSKFILNYLKLRECPLEGLAFDLYLALYLLDPGRSLQSLVEVANRYLVGPYPAREEVLGKGARAKKLEDIDIERVMEISGGEAASLLKLKDIILKEMEEKGLKDLFYDLELPLVRVLSSMELAGIKVDREMLQAMSEDIREKIGQLEGKIYAQAGEIFNINSPKQLSYILFEKLGLPPLKKIKTGYSTDARVLEELAPRHQVVELILHYRQLIKLQGTYLEGLLPLVNPGTGRIHTTYKQNITATGRLSSTEPNLQNIPVRLEEGRKIRKVFIPGQQQVLLAADYSQIELRVLAHFSKDEQLVQSFIQGEDIHRRTAAEIFELSLEEVSPALRNRAKAVNFGIVYGISDYGLSQNIKIPRQEAREYIQNYFKKYPGVQDYSQGVISQARRDGYVTTLLNRRRYLPDINHRSQSIRSLAERSAINTPIQGSAADIIKMAMLLIFEDLQEEGLQARMLLQVHDELIFEVPRGELENLAGRVKDRMENIVTLRVPLRVDLKKGDDWCEMEKLFI